LSKAISIGVAVLALAALFDARASVNAADASSQVAPAKHQMRKATVRPHDRVVVRGDEGYYYDRPVYYRPYPYQLPAPFFLGLAFAPPW
jgi:hypothetical protein